MRTLVARRPEMMFLVALGVLAVALVLRFARPQDVPTLAYNSDSPAPAPVELSAETMIAKLQERIKARPDDADAYGQLGLAYLQRVRETADPSLYDKAGAALDEAVKRDPKSVDALVGQ